MYYLLQIYGWDTHITFTQNNKLVFKNNSAQFNDYMIVVSSINVNISEIFSIQNVTEPFLPLWQGERSDIPYGLVFDWQNKIRLTFFNTLSHPQLLTAQLSS